MVPGTQHTDGGGPQTTGGGHLPPSGSIADQKAQLRAAWKALTSTELAETRTALAAERTLMAWIRTALAMISFGFSIYNFIRILNPSNERAPHRLGIILAALGTFSLVAGSLQYGRTVRSLEGRPAGFTLYVACAVIVLGLIVLAGLVFRLGPLR
jgi:putative membrane protein